MKSPNVMLAFLVPTKVTDSKKIYLRADRIKEFSETEGGTIIPVNPALYGGGFVVVTESGADIMEKLAAAAKRGCTATWDK